MEILLNKLIMTFALSNQGHPPALLATIRKEGLNGLTPFRISSDSSASPVVLITNCCIYPFDEKTYARTRTKTYYNPTGNQHLLNVTAATAIALIEQGVRVLMHIPDDIFERVNGLIALHPKRHLLRCVTGNLYDIAFARTIYENFEAMNQAHPISRIDFCIYDSYAFGLKNPFLPMHEDKIENAHQLSKNRITLFHNMVMIAYDLLINRNQQELRFLCQTALATVRPSSHLFMDTLHKIISHNFLVTMSYEMPYYTKKNISIIELAPGMVDSGVYDNYQTRLYTYQEALLDGFPFAESVSLDDIQSWPMMSNKDLADVAVAYLCAKNGEDINQKLSPELRKLTLAGRTESELHELLKESVVADGSKLLIPKRLPDYCYIAGTTWNGFPKLTSGYIPIMLTPQGQYF